MSRRQALLRLSPLALVLLVGGGYGFNGWARGHVLEMSKGNVTSLDCRACHFGGAGPRDYARELLHPSPRGLALAADGGELYVSCEGTDEVVVVSTSEREVLRRLRVGSRPNGLAASPDGALVYVALTGEDRVAAVDAQNGEELGSLPVGRAPIGLDLDRAGALLAVANSDSDDVSIVAIDGAGSMSERARLAAGRQPYEVALSEDGRRAFVANRLAVVGELRAVPSSELTVIDVARKRVVNRASLHSSHLSEGVATSDELGLALVPFVRVRNTLPITQVSRGWVMTSGLGLLSPFDGNVRQFPLDEMNAYFADPSGVVIDAGRARAYVASGGADCVSVVDLRRVAELAAACEGDGPGEWADHLGISAEYVIARVPVGPNPRALILSPDGGTLYVAERLGDALAFVDTEALEVVARVGLGAPPVPSAERRGEIVFHNAAVTFQGQFACRSCHPDGHVDGLAYDFAIDGLGLNILDNRSLLGIADTAPFKWNGKNESLHVQCGPRFAMVLTFADPFPENELDDLVAYIESLPPPLHPQGTELNAAQLRGKHLFERAADKDGEEIAPGDRCTFCHPPPLFTNRLPSTVATKAKTDTVEQFDTPHLVGIGFSAPYLHDGRARTLEEIWTVHSPENTHGKVNDMTKAQLNDLVEYLKTL